MNVVEYENKLNDVILKELDKEWVELMILAKKTGISSDGVRRFLSSNQKSTRQDDIIRSDN